MRNVNILGIIMCFCLPLTVISLPQCTHAYWAVQCERKGKMKRWRRLRGLAGVYCWKKPVDLSAGIFSPPPPLLNETHNKASSVCVVSSSIHLPNGKHSPSFSAPHPHPHPHPVCLTSSFSLSQDAFGEFLFSEFSSLAITKREQNLTAHVLVCVCTCLISLSS